MSDNGAETVADTSSTAPNIRSEWLSKSAAKTKGSDKKEVQFHYDISNDFFKLWQDPTQTYSCAYFERDDMTLEEAQIAKIDLALGKLGLQPGMTLLDIGCGWGSTIMRAVDKYDVNVIGLTLSENQKRHIEEHWFANSTSKRRMEVRLQPWEEFDEPVDRVVSIGAFEHFGFSKYADYFKKTFNILPDDGVQLLHSIIIPSDEEVRAKQLKITMSHLRFIKFIMDEIYPGGRLPLAALIEEHATKAGFTVTRVQHLQPNYVKTLDTWAANLEAKKDEAIAITSEEIYERFVKYLRGCSDLFREGYTDVAQFTLEKAPA
ncbi:cyclopropane mycolic acid synthase family methyltransferase [Mycobacterium sp. 1274761.0]|uniref:cyclopropane mycolic acid synthase family methyltransferase n=1 Tax=Mycobacterium sp. 1274761.0 TaxID=1834077 RepID=UPI0008010380|nr:SAM-dependent methyltransferase [Mycobacterium sp. 1274761.0]